MKRGKTEVETLQLNGWGVGDILEGNEGYGPSRILITAMGEELFLCRWDYKVSGNYYPESGSTTLKCREWTKVGTLHPKEIVGHMSGLYYTSAGDLVLVYPDNSYEVYCGGTWNHGMFDTFKASAYSVGSEYMGEL